MSAPGAAPEAGAEDGLRALITRAEQRADTDPDAARELLVEASEQADLEAADPIAFARACEVFARVALLTEADDLLERAVVQGVGAWNAAGQPRAAARLFALGETARALRPYQDDREALGAEHAFVTRLLEHLRQLGEGAVGPDPELVLARAVLARRRRLPLASTGELPAVERIRAEFGLDAFAHACLMAVSGPAVDERLARALRDTQGDLMARSPGAWFLRELLQPSFAGPVELDALEEEAPLRAFELVSLTPHPDRPRDALAHGFVEIAPEVTAYLVGRARIATPLRPLARMVDPPLDPVSVGEELERRLGTTTGALALPQGPRRVMILGAVGAGKKACAADLGRRLGRRLLVLDGFLLGTDPAKVAAQIRLAMRDARLQHAFLAVDLRDGVGSAGTAGPVPGALPALLAIHGALAATAEQPVFLIAREAESLAPLYDATSIELRIPSLGFDEQVAQFERALARNGVDAPSAELLRSICQVGLTPGTIERAIERAAARARGVRPERPRPTGDELRDAVRYQFSTSLSTIAQRVVSPFRWDDLVLPDEAAGRLREMVAFIRHQKQVFDDWGFSAKFPYGRGLSALFAGPPGTGKTMAASVMAAELGLDLFRIDLSQVVSKYIGETEKNLGQLFDRAANGQAVLLFDEADSLFAKRTDVKTSIDRYSNLEVNYLLQRLEGFEGITILTTNFLKNIDEAFRRRLRFIIEFPFPDPPERERLWRATIPAEAATEGEVQYGLLSKLELAGGSIKNAVMRAAFAAASRGGAINSIDMVQAALVELESMGRLTPDAANLMARLAPPPPPPPLEETLREHMPIELPDLDGDGRDGDGPDAPDEPPAAEDPAGRRRFIPNFPFPKRRG